MNGRKKCLVMFVVMMCVVSSPCVAQNCNQNPENHFGCPTFSLQPRRRCTVETHQSPHFSFYFKPGQDFRSLKIIIKDMSGIDALTMTLDTNKFGRQDHWYKISLRGEEKKLIGYHIKSFYHLSVDDQLQETIEISFIQISSIEVVKEGTASYTNQCNPNDYPPPPPPPPPPPTSSSRPRSPPPSVLTSPEPSLQDPSTIDSQGATGEHSDTGLNNETTRAEPMSSDNAFFASLLQHPWWVYAAMAAAVFLLISTVTLVAVCMRRKRTRRTGKDATRDQEQAIQANQTDDNPADQVSADEANEPVYDNPSEYAYGNPVEDEPVYEEVGIWGPLIPEEPPCGGPNGIAQEDWLHRRGSAHESENSIYVPFH